MEWVYLGKGSYNKVYQSKDKLHIFKVQIESPPQLDSIPDRPDRSVRLWNEINPGFPAEIAQQITVPAVSIPAVYNAQKILIAPQVNIAGGIYDGWVCPYIKGKAPSDQEISNTIIDIFNRTGRIITDGPGNNNFKKMQNGKVICIDIGLALILDKRDKVYYQGKLIRSKSSASLEVWENVGNNFDTFYKHTLPIKPKTVRTIKALLFIQINRPDIFDVGFLMQSPDLITQLANAYDQQLIIKKIDSALIPIPKETVINPPKEKVVPAPTKLSIKETEKSRAAAQKIVNQGLQILKDQRPIKLSHIVDSCVVELRRYISTRGTMDSAELFNPSLVTTLFRNKDLTVSKVKIALKLITTLESAVCSEDMTKAIQAAIDTPNALKSNFTSGLNTSLGKCINIVVKTRKELEQALTNNPTI
jgi:hypothetical protein